jgi:hypothetical protein
VADAVEKHVEHSTGLYTLLGFAGSHGDSTQSHQHVVGCAMPAQAQC